VTPVFGFFAGPSGSSEILALGEPNVGHVDGVTELYFVYVLKRSGGGYDANVGVLCHR
jgi:hypothetical protein